MANSIECAAALLVCSAALSCGPVQSASTNGVERCPKPCPSACPNSCLPSGYCAEIVNTAAELGLNPIYRDESWMVSFSGFPPNAELGVSINAGFDVVERDGLPSVYLHISILLAGIGWLSTDGTQDSFPVWRDLQGDATSDATGTLQLNLPLGICDASLNGVNLAAQPHCLVAPDSTFTVTLIDTAAWLEAPICDQ